MTFSAGWHFARELECAIGALRHVIVSDGRHGIFARVFQTLQDDRTSSCDPCERFLSQLTLPRSTGSKLKNASLRSGVSLRGSGK